MRWVAAIALTCLVGIQPAFAQDEAVPTLGDTETTAAESGMGSEEAPTATAEATAPTELQATETTPESTESNSDATETAATVESTEETQASEPLTEDPTNLERIIVTSVAGVVAAAGLAAGVTFGVLAMQEYGCLSDVVECNKSRDKPIEGQDFLDARQEVERKALYADMGYLVAATAAVVAIVGAVELLFGAAPEASE